ncbi:MAG: MGMT family protein [bacterium]
MFGEIKIMNVFAKRVYGVVRRIKEGKTLTYGEVAYLAGFPGAARAVGNVLSKNYDTAIPCHRVVRADGKPGGYNRGMKNKVKLLCKEKIAS